MNKAAASAVLALFLMIPFATAESVLSADTIKFWNTWFGAPTEYLTSWPSIFALVVAPVVIAMFFAYEIWKELGLFHSGAANFWIPILLVYLMINNGFWSYVKLFVSNTQMVPALVLSFLSLQVTGKLRSRVTSFGYSGIFSGILAYALDAVGVGIFMAGLGFIFTRGQMGPLVYVLFSVGAGLGIFLIWWDKKGKRNTANLNSIFSQDEIIEKEIAKLEKKRDELNDKATRAPNEAARLPYYKEMALLQQEIKILEAKRGVVETSLEKAVT